MYLIAVCDDSIEVLDQTSKMLELYGKRSSQIDLFVECFENAQQLIDRVRDKNDVPDLIFMDIYLPDKSGIDAARELRNMQIQSKIVFLTISRDYAFEAFQVDAIQYLVKPVEEKVLFSTMNKLMENMDKEDRKYILLRMEGRTWRIQLSNILYIEAWGKNQWLWLADGTQHLLHLTMAEIYGMLAPYQAFVKVGVTYIVNLEYIDSLNVKGIRLSTGKEIYLPRGSYKVLKEQYFTFCCED